MKKIISAILCILVFASVSAYAKGFNDIDGHWAEDVIKKWEGSGYINGYPDGSFRPDGVVSRGELAKILSAVFDLADGEDPVYDDVSADEWYYPYLKKTAGFIPNYSLPMLTESNLPYHESSLKGRNDFLPKAYALRAHIAEALVKIKTETEDIALEEMPIREINRELDKIYEDYETATTPMGKIPANVERMNRYMYYAYKLNIMTGDGEYFYPYNYMTRAELLTAIDRMKK